MSERVKAIPGLAASRGLRIVVNDDETHSLIINISGGGGDYMEIRTATTALGPALIFYDIQDGRDLGERKYLAMLTTRGARSMCRYLPIIINTAERLSRRQS